VWQRLLLCVTEEPFVHRAFFEALRYRGIPSQLVPTPSGSDYRIPPESIIRAVHSALESLAFYDGIGLPGSRQGVSVSERGLAEQLNRQPPRPRGPPFQQNWPHE
jgi:hypothetical protein